MIAQDLKAHFEGTAPIISIATGGVFWRKPHLTSESVGDDPYIVYTRPDLGENDIREQHRVQIVCFAKDSVIAENLASAIRDSLRSINSINGNQYYIIEFINQVDGDDKLDNGFYYVMLNYFMRKT